MNSKECLQNTSHNCIHLPLILTLRIPFAPPRTLCVQVQRLTGSPPPIHTSLHISLHNTAPGRVLHRAGGAAVVMQGRVKCPPVTPPTPPNPYPCPLPHTFDVLSSEGLQPARKYGAALIFYWQRHRLVFNC